MKTFDVNKKSWHYKLSKFGENRYDVDADDICSYTRNVIYGMFASSLCIIGICIGLYAAGDFIAWLIACIQYSSFLHPQLGAIIIVDAIGVIFMVVLYSGTSVFFSCQREKEGSFVHTAYKSWKDKYCIKVNIL